MLQFLKWSLHVKYAFFGRCVFSSKSTLFYRKKLFLVFSMCTKKVFCVWEVSRNRFFCILKQSDFNTEWMLFPIKMFYNKKSQRKNNVLGLKSRIGKKKRHYIISFLPDCGRHSCARWDIINKRKYGPGFYAAEFFYHHF